MTVPPTVSVVIPCYNGARFLPDTLASAVGQTRPPLEVVVVDDGSTDDSAAVAERFGPPVRVLRQPNRGESVARNRGIDAARGDWVALLDADDVWEPEKLARQLDAAAARPDAVGVFTDYQLLVDGKLVAEPQRPDYHLAANPPLALLLDWGVLPSSALVRAADARAVRFEEATRTNEDVLFFAALAARGPLVRVREPLTRYRRTAGQQTQRPLHDVEAAVVRAEFARSRPDLYPPADVDAVVRAVMPAVCRVHDAAYYGRRFDQVRACRAAARRVVGPAAAVPAGLAGPLPPAWVYWVWDRIRPGRRRVEAGSGSGGA